MAHVLTSSLFIIRRQAASIRHPYLRSYLSTNSTAFQRLLERTNAKENDANAYLAKFRTMMKDSTQCFAVIKVGGEVLESEQVLGDLAKDCTILQQLGLKPIVIHGGGPQMNDELKRQGVEPEYIRKLQ